MRNAIVGNLVVAGAIFGQAVGTAPNTKLEFEAASVRPAGPPVPGRLVLGGLRGGPGSTDPGRMSGTVNLRTALLQAFGMAGDQIFGPDWMGTERYEVSAVVPPGATKEQYDVMLQNLLIDRFQISMHYGKKNFDVYEMRIAKGGLKAKPSQVQAAPPDSTVIQADPVAATAGAQNRIAEIRTQVAPNGERQFDAEGFPLLGNDNRPSLQGTVSKGRMLISARGQPISQIAQTLQNGLGSGARIVDRTGVAGLFDFKVFYSWHIAGAPPPRDTDEPAPDVVEAAESQLGLKLEKTSVPFDVLVIDRAEKKPTEN